MFRAFLSFVVLHNLSKELKTVFARGCVKSVEWFWMVLIYFSTSSNMSAHAKEGTFEAKQPFA